ncbi:uncharacterized protein I206_103464 [Kwoniella pini CBS 10737]|uniref:NmrA-like domain-containing protein n=1 Tax=Kwoniella pini CBS 10737 TaxID=1296096 RepID=A0A1B9I9X4_9TREE|nr:uncharacterized protein I206_01533 [Kwoniella pini CBS 10737]OCF52247.1 hypothetical protein I206_01533 [Kwoniella pini CBS 10737]
MSSTPVIGFIGYSGLVGKSVLNNLIEHHNSGKVKLIILHREGSDVSLIPENVEKRLIQLDSNGFEKNKKAVEGLEVLLSTVGFQGLESQKYLIDALEGSKTLKTFIPSDFGTNWSEEELKANGLKALKVKEDIVNYLKEKKLSFTNIRTGAFDGFVFAYQAGGTDLKGNKQQIFRNSLNNKFRITSIPYLGFSLSQLLLKPDELINKTIQLFDYSPTGQDFINILTKINNGKKTEIINYSEEQYKLDLENDIGLAISAALKAKWGDNNFGDSNVPKIQGWNSKSLEELARQYV